MSGQDSLTLIIISINIINIDIIINIIIVGTTMLASLKTDVIS